MKNNEVKDLLRAFEEATSITVSLVTLPVLLLIVGLLIDKALSTTPLFILVGVGLGVTSGIWRALKLSKQIKK